MMHVGRVEERCHLIHCVARAADGLMKKNITLAHRPLHPSRVSREF